MLFRRKKELTFFEKTKNFIYPEKGLIRSYKYLLKRITRIPDKTHAIAIGVSCGVGISMTPFIGLQIILTMILCFILRGSITAGIISTAIGNPLTFPFIWIGSYKIGIYILENQNEQTKEIAFMKLFEDMKESISTMDLMNLKENILPILTPMMIGGAILGIIFGTLSYYLVIGIIDEYKRKHKEKIEEAMKKNKAQNDNRNRNRYSKQ